MTPAVRTTHFYDSELIILPDSLELHRPYLVRANHALCPDGKRRNARPATGTIALSAMDTLNVSKASSDGHWPAYVWAGKVKVEGYVWVDAIDASQGAMERTVKFVPTGKRAAMVGG